MSKNYEFSWLEWDSEFLGVNAARVNLIGRADQDEQDEVINLCEGYDFVTISNHGNINENNKWIGLRTKAFLVDINIQFQKPIIDCMDIQDGAISLTNFYPRNEDLLRIASESFVYSRFFNDLQIPQNKAKNIYRHWTECAFDKEYKYFVVCEKAGRVAGYILFSRNGDSCNIELIAVDKLHQGQKVGKSLIQGLESFVLTQGYNKITVGTQVNNTLAAQFYISKGFTYTGCGSVYHLWK